MHFFNPAPVLPLVEVVRTELADEEAVETAYAFAERLGKQPIRCNDTPGFVVNRILIPLLNDCVRVLDEADVTPEDLDKAMRFGVNWPIGPCALLDLIGIDIHVHASEALEAALGEPRMGPPARLVEMAARAGSAGRPGAASSSTKARAARRSSRRRSGGSAGGRAGGRRGAARTQSPWGRPDTRPRSAAAAARPRVPRTRP